MGRYDLREQGGDAGKNSGLFGKLWNLRALLKERRYLQAEGDVRGADSKGQGLAKKLEVTRRDTAI